MIEDWEQGQDSNLRPSGYEPDELPDCSTLLQKKKTLFGFSKHKQRKSQASLSSAFVLSSRA